MHTKKLDNGYIHYLREGTPRIAPFLRIEDVSLLLRNTMTNSQRDSE